MSNRGYVKPQISPSLTINKLPSPLSTPVYQPCLLSGALDYLSYPFPGGHIWSHLLHLSELTLPFLGMPNRPPRIRNCFLSASGPRTIFGTLLLPIAEFPEQGGLGLSGKDKKKQTLGLLVRKRDTWLAWLQQAGHLSAELTKAPKEGKAKAMFHVCNIQGSLNWSNS